MAKKKIKDKRGGERPGAGRKTGPPTMTLGIRHKVSVIEKVRKKLNPKELQKKGREWLDSIAKNNG